MILAPVPVTTNVVFPTADILTLPFAAGILTLLLPFASGPIKLAADKLPEKFPVPVILAPVPVTTNVVFPAATMFTLPSIAGILTLLVPFDTVALTSVNAAPLPTNPVAVIYPFAKLAEKLAFDCKG